MAFTRRETAILIIGDFIAMVAALWSALLIRNFETPSVSYFESNLVPFLPVFAVSFFVFYIAGLYEKQTRPVKRTMGTRVFGAQVANVTVAALLFFLLPLSIAPKTILVLFLLASVVYIAAWRFFIVPHITSVRRERAVLVGQGRAVEEVFEEVNGNPAYRLYFSELIDTTALSSHSVNERVHAAVRDGARIVVLDSREGSVRPQLSRLYDLMVSGVSFHEFAVFYEEVFDRVPIAHVDHAWLLECLPKQRVLYDVGKRLVDIVGALIAGVIALPFILMCAILAAALGRPAFFRNQRIGKGGKLFHLLKLQTMEYNDQGDPELRKKNRVTTLGAFLRKTRLDELPQLWNILAGDISFIGPRPELPSLAAVYHEEIPFYDARLLIQPGLSGWAQIRDYDAPKGGVDIARTERKLSYDLYYLKHRSFGLDFVIALKTLRALLSFSGK